mgnify:CR=1 FL=1
MKTYAEDLHWRKFTDIDREYPILELVEVDQVLLDLGISDEGVWEFSIHSFGGGKVMTLELFESMLQSGKEILQKELE